MAETGANLRRFTRNNLQHPAYQALAELGKAVTPGRHRASVAAGVAVGTRSSRLAFSSSARRTMAASIPLKISLWIGYSPYQ
jgi:hypothetical protein